MVTRQMRVGADIDHVLADNNTIRLTSVGVLLPGWQVPGIMLYIRARVASMSEEGSRPPVAGLG